MSAAATQDEGALTPEREGDAVAARSRSSKATLYRQLQGKPRLVAGASRHLRPSLDRLDAGSLRGDPHEPARRLGEQRRWTSP
jgi:hypothetical protein